jgi:hypothetical protein
VASEAWLATRRAAGELRRQVLAAVASGVSTLPAIAGAIGYETWGRGGRYMRNADRERLVRALKTLEGRRLVYRDYSGRYLPYDYEGHLAALRIRERLHRARAAFAYRVARRAEMLAARLWLEIERLERLRVESPND